MEKKNLTEEEQKKYKEEYDKEYGLIAIFKAMWKRSKFGVIIDAVLILNPLAYMIVHPAGWVLGVLMLGIGFCCIFSDIMFTRLHKINCRLFDIIDEYAVEIQLKDSQIKLLEMKLKDAQDKLGIKDDESENSPNGITEEKLKA